MLKMLNSLEKTSTMLLIKLNNSMIVNYSSISKNQSMLILMSLTTPLNLSLNSLILLLMLNSTLKIGNNPL
jgi:hypothetical protein